MKKKQFNTTQTGDELSLIVDQLFQQLKPCLPIDSIEKIRKELDEIELSNHRLPLDTFMPFISKDIFPIKSEEELHKKLSDGVRHTVALVLAGSIPVGKKEHIDIFANDFQKSRGELKPPQLARKIYTFSSFSKTKIDK